MPTSTAVSAQGSTFSIEGAAGSAITITAITKAVSAVVTASNTLAVGDVVKFGSVTGMPEILGLLGIVTVASGSSFTVNIDSSGFATVGTSGTATPKTWLAIGNIKDFTGLDGSVSEIDVTHLQSDAMEYRPGLQDFGNFGFNCDLDDADVGQTAVKAAKAQTNNALAVKAYKLRLPNGKLRVFEAFCKKFSEQGGVNNVVRSSVDLRITGVVRYG